MGTIRVITEVPDDPKQEAVNVYICPGCQSVKHDARELAECMKSHSQLLCD